MAILLVHLRRIILLFSVVYLSGALVRRLVASGGARYPKINKLLRPKRLHLQVWVYIYTLYAYLIVLNSFGWNHINIFNTLQS